jgi:hypothetical protein
MKCLACVARLERVERFIEAELDQRRASMLPTSDKSDLDYIGLAIEALADTRAALAHARGEK